MILATHGIVGSSAGGFDADYQAVLDYATTQGYTLPSASQQLLQEQLIVDLKTAGIWSKLDTFAVFATDGDSDFALIDWKRLTQYTAVNSPTFTTNDGYRGDGISAYIDSNYITNTNWVNISQNNIALFAYTNIDTPETNKQLIGTNTNDYILLNPKNPNSDSTFRLHRNGSGASQQSFIQVVGLHSISRNSNTSFDYYVNGSIGNANISENSATETRNIFLFRNSTNYRDVALSMCGWGAYLDSTENSDLYNAWNNYYTSL